MEQQVIKTVNGSLAVEMRFCACPQGDSTELAEEQTRDSPLLFTPPLCICQTFCLLCTPQVLQGGFAQQLSSYILNACVYRLVIKIQPQASRVSKTMEKDVLLEKGDFVPWGPVLLAISHSPPGPTCGMSTCLREPQPLPLGLCPMVSGGQACPMRKCNP